ncbi:MAG: early set domain-containing protein [Anaerolineae bacterium]
MITKTYSNNKRGRMRVTFSVPQSACVERIELAIARNDDLVIQPLRLAETGGWYLSLDLLAGFVYRFHYLCDGWQWMGDGSADGYERNDIDKTYICLLDTNTNNGDPSQIEPPYSTLAAPTVAPVAESAVGC